MRDELDLLLDDALKSYTAVDPSPGLATRIVERAQDDLTPRRRIWAWAMGFALPLAAAGALAFVLAGRLALPRPPTAVVASLPAVPRIPEQQVSEQPDMARSIETHSSEKRQAVYTSDTRPAFLASYSSEELALISFVQQHPKEAAEVVKAQSRDAEPLTVAPLQAQPISIAALKEEN
jgi:hypothetical protein